MISSASKQPSTMGEDTAGDGAREALAIVASAKDNEITSYPFWIVVDPRQIMSPSVSSVASMVKGLFFSRESANAYVASHRHRYGKRVGVFCCSGSNSPEYRDLYAASRELQAPAAPSQDDKTDERR